MELSAAKLDQIVDAGPEFMVVDRDVGGVVEEIKRLDPQLGVRFHPRQGFFSVFWRSEDGSSEYLVTTVQAYQNSSGTWEGLDGRLVDRLRRIDGHGRSGYDYARALEEQNRQADKARADAKAELYGELGELAAHAVRKDLGATSRAFISKGGK